MSKRKSRTDSQQANKLMIDEKQHAANQNQNVDNEIQNVMSSFLIFSCFVYF